MTQIIAAVTQDYVLHASDRRLIYGAGARAGQVYNDDSCKLVNMCGTTGIAYSGIAEMEGRTPTHEWIAKNLAAARCVDAASAERVLVERTPLALRAVPADLRRHSFVMAGWAHFGDPPSVRPYYSLVTNELDPSFAAVEGEKDAFVARRQYLRENERPLMLVLGEPITVARASNLERNLARLSDRRIGPQEALRLLSEEIINTSQQCSRVCAKILAFCIPRKAAQSFFETGKSAMVATQPNDEAPAFSYFEEGYQELKQYGPTTICGEWAVTGVVTENDPSREYQSSQFRILALPQRVRGEQ